jgi:hypothetical protein
MFRLRHLMLCCCASAIPAFAQQRHLFLDPDFAQEVRGASLHTNPPQRREIVIKPDRPWEQLMISFYLTVMEDQGRLRLWYICRDKADQANVAYAESADGISWTKPNLGIVDYAGSRDNNLIGITSLEGVVFRDPNASPQERYAYITHLITQGMVRFHSADGLHWRHDAAPLLKFGADSQNVTFWDERLGRYVMYLRGWRTDPDKRRYRTVVRAETKSIAQPFDVGPTEKSWHPWGKDKNAVIGDEFPTVFAADELDPANCDVYNISALPYPPDPRWYLGFPSMFQRDKRISDGRLEVQFAGSVDGVRWHRYDRKPYAPLGLAGSESANMTFMGTGMVVRGDEIWQYGTGFLSRHGDREARMKRTDGVIYRYVQRMDGFVSLDFDAAGGSCVTAPVKVEGRKLVLNVDTGALGNLRVGLFDASGAALAEFSAAQCEVLRTNSTHAVVSWKGRDDLASIEGKTVRLALAGSRAKLYGFYFDQPPIVAP